MVVVPNADNAAKGQSAGVVCGAPDECIRRLFRSDSDYDGIPAHWDGVRYPGGRARAKVRITVRSPDFGNVSFPSVRAFSTDFASTTLDPRGQGTRPGRGAPGIYVGRISYGPVQEFGRISDRLG